MEIQQKLLTINPYSRPGTKIGKIKNIVIHWVGNAGSSAISNRNYFEGLKDKKAYASSHYIIGLEGEIIQCVPESEVAYHGNSANSYSIGIENCHSDWEGKFNDKTYTSLVELCADLCKRYSLDPSMALIRHYDVTKKDCPHYYVQNTQAWVNLKNDVKAAMSTEDAELSNAVSKIILSGININFNAWKRIDLINLKNVSGLISKLGGINYLVDKKIISDAKIWDNGTYTVQNVRSLLIKYASKI